MKSALGEGKKWKMEIQIQIQTQIQIQRAHWQGEKDKWKMEIKGSNVDAGSPEIFGNTQEYLELLNCWALHTTEAEDSKTCESRISGQWLCLMCVFMLRVFALYM